jgi:bud site selection protein 31
VQSLAPISCCCEAVILILIVFGYGACRPIHQINWQKSRYVYDMYYTYERISREVYDYCINNKLVDAALIAKWKKPGYERLCSTYTINPRNYKFGTVSICRVPKQSLPPGAEIEDPMTGCRGIIFYLS